MSNIQSKIIRHAEKQKDTTHNEKGEKIQSVKTDPEMIQMIELVEDIRMLSLFFISSRR